MGDRQSAIDAALVAALDRPVRVSRREAMGDGDISQVERLHTDVGTFIVKSHWPTPGLRPSSPKRLGREGGPSAPAGFFRAEAAGLTTLRTSGTPLRVPAVVAHSDESTPFLILEDLGSGQRGPGFEEAFGRGLAELHRQTAGRFGFEHDTFCGTTRQPNPWTDSWVDFYRQSRIRFQVSLITRAQLISVADARRIDHLVEGLDTIIDEPADGPSLIHGDLWSGNLHVTDRGEPALIDPSVYFAHREAELGMMRLFGNFSERAYAAYDEAFPLEPGWRDRNPIYQLYHLLNHLTLFGGSYRQQVMAVVDRFV